MLEAIPADFLRRLKMCPQEVRGMEVMRLLGDNVNPHNRMKTNWLCGFVVCAERKKYVLGFPYFPCFLVYLKSRKIRKIWKI